MKAIFQKVSPDSTDVGISFVLCLVTFATYTKQILGDGGRRWWEGRDLVPVFAYEIPYIFKSHGWALDVGFAGIIN